MFNVKKIYTNHSTTRFLCDCICDSNKTAEYIVASFLGSVRMYYFCADLYAKNSRVILDTPNIEKTIELSILLNNSISKMQ